MKAVKIPSETVEYMEFPSVLHPEPSWFKDCLKVGTVYRLAGSYYVRTGVGTVSFPTKGYVLVRFRTGALSVVERAEFFRLFEKVKE